MNAYNKDLLFPELQYENENGCSTNDPIVELNMYNLGYVEFF